MIKKYVFILFLFSILFTKTQIFSQTAQYGFYDKFYIGILDNGLEHNYAKFGGLNLNLWCHYSNWWDTNPNLHGWDNGWTDWEPNDYLLANYSQYSGTISGILSTNSGKNLRTMMDRVKLNRLCYGQRSEYQAEKKNLCDPFYDFYSFANSVDNGIWAADMRDNAYNNGNYVKHCWPDPSYQAGTPVTILSNLNSNREQVNTVALSNHYEIDKYHNFYIKPKIRIPQSFVIPANLETPVCRLKVYAWDGVTVIKDITLKVKYFTNEIFQYDGNYKEEYNYHGDNVDLIIDNLSDSINKFNPDNHRITDPICNVDFQVEWLGNCEMWIDYVRVDDDVANDLFGSGTTHDLYMDWLQWEADLAQEGNDNALKFYLEEFEMNNIPCIAHVNNKLKLNSGYKFSLMCDLNVGEYYWLQRRNLYFGVPDLTAEIVKHTLIDSANLDEVYTFSYPLMGSVPGIQAADKNGRLMPSVYKIPNTLPVSGPNSIDSGILAAATSPAEYDDWLQFALDDDPVIDNSRFTPMMKLADETSKLCNKPFVNIVQAHLWCTPN